MKNVVWSKDSANLNQDILYIEKKDKKYCSDCYYLIGIFCFLLTNIACNNL